jgi:hypothetical protein
MGTTVTTNLALIKPDTDESIKAVVSPPSAGWAVQNGLNADKIDSLFRHTSTHTWTPTWTADTANPTLGAGGFTDGKYIRLYPRLVIGYFRLFTGGAGFAAGTGLYGFTLPVAPAAELLTMSDSIVMGKGYIHDNDTVATSTASVLIFRITDNTLVFRGHAGDYWRNTTPMTLAQNDRASGYFVYPTSAP